MNSGSEQCRGCRCECGGVGGGEGIGVCGGVEERGCRCVCVWRGRWRREGVGVCVEG